MLTKLLESRAHQARYAHFMVASATIHIMLIYVATSATVITTKAYEESRDPVVLHWVPLPKPISPARAALPDGISRLVSTIPRRSWTVPIEIPTSLPSIDLTPTIDPSDFTRGASGSSGTTDPTATTRSTGDGRRAYDVLEVETAVTAIGNTVPEYPRALRASGVEGKVNAEFVVTESGRADAASLRIISATNDAFVESIRRALPRMRFSPARIGDRPVAQLVQQQFVFRLGR